MERLNTMCRACGCLSDDCAGTACSTWTGCIYRRATDNQKSFDVYQPLISREAMDERKILASKLREGF